MTQKKRLEKDLLGELEVPAKVYWGINTQRALMNFQISGKTFPKEFLLSLATVKRACLEANETLGRIDEEKIQVIRMALKELLDEHKLLDQFPVDVFQSGSGTQTNMNMNEVLANRANELLGYPLGKKSPIHPNDHINMSQSSNDVIPTAMHISAIEMINKLLIPAMNGLEYTLNEKVIEFKDIIKVGRTHLQDAVPIPLSLEFSVYKEQLVRAKKRIQQVLEELYFLPIGGTALGTGLNAPVEFAQIVVTNLIKITGYPLKVNPVKAEGIASHNTIVNVSNVLKALALSLLKLANDIRWLGSGPRAGLGELCLPENEPGSSIMPGKINPTQAESLIQVCLQVIGNDLTISSAEGFNSILDLNVAKPIMIVSLLESITILSNGMNSFVKNCLLGIKVNKRNIENQLNNALMIVTRLTPVIGYEKAGEIAKKAYKTNKTIREIITEIGLQIENLDEILDLKKMV